MTQPPTGKYRSAPPNLCDLFTDEGKKSPQQKRWERRWAAASGAWFATLLAVLVGGTNWRVAVMVTATAIILVRAVDMLDE